MHHIQLTLPDVGCEKQLTCFSAPRLHCKVPRHEQMKLNARLLLRTEQHVIPEVGFDHDYSHVSSGEMSPAKAYIRANNTETPKQEQECDCCRHSVWACMVVTCHAA